MRTVKSIPDVQKAITDLYSKWDAGLTAKHRNLNGNKIMNAAPATAKGEYVTFEQLPVFTPTPQKNIDQHFTIVFDKDGSVTDGDSTPGYIFGNNREGTPIQIWVAAEVAPTTEDLVINVAYTTYEQISGMMNPTTVNLLAHDLHLPVGQTLRVFSSTFADPLPMFGNGAKANGLIITGGDAAVVSIGLVVKRLQKQNVR